MVCQAKSTKKISSTLFRLINFNICNTRFYCFVAFMSQVFIHIFCVSDVTHYLMSSSLKHFTHSLELSNDMFFALFSFLQSYNVI